MKPPIKNLARLALPVLLLAAHSASALVIDFNAQHNSDYAIFANPYSESGFTLTNNGNGGTNDAGLFWGDSSGYNANVGGATFSHNYGGSTTTLTKNDSTTFSFDSIDLGDVYNNGSAGDVRFDFLFGDASTGTQTVSLDNLTGLQTFIFGLTNLQSIAWTAISTQGNWLQLDNIAVDGTPTSSVPEPSALALLAVGIVGLIASRRRAQA